MKVILSPNVLVGGGVLLTVALIGGFTESVMYSRVLFFMAFFTLFILGFATYIIFIGGKVQYGFHLLHVILGGLIGAFILSTLFAQEQRDSLIGSVDNFAYTLPFLLSLLIGSIFLSFVSKKVSKRIFYGIEIGITISSLYTAIISFFGNQIAQPLGSGFQFLGVNEVPSSFISTDISHALIAAYLIALIAVCRLIALTVLSQSEQARLSGLVYLMFLFVVNALFIITQATTVVGIGGNILFIIGGAAVIFFLAQRGFLMQNNTITKVGFLMYASVAAAFVNLVFSPLGAYFQGRIQEMTDFVLPTLARVFSGNFITGVGLGNITQGWDKFSPEAYNLTTNWNGSIHSLGNTYLDMFMQGGILLFLLSIVFALAVVYFGYITIIKKQLTFSPLYYGSYVGLLFLFIGGLLFSPTPIILVLGSFFLAFFIREHIDNNVFLIWKKELSVSEFPVNIVSGLSFGIMIIYILVFVAGIQYSQVIQADRGLVSALQATEEGRAQQQLEQVVSRYPWSSQAVNIYTQLQVQEALEKAQELNTNPPQEGQESDAQDQLQERVQNLQEALSGIRNSRSNTYSSYALSLQRLNQLQRQLGVVVEDDKDLIRTRAQELSPRRPEPYVYEANDLILQVQNQQLQGDGQNQETDPSGELLSQAESALDKALELKPDYAEAYIVYTSLLQLQEEGDTIVEKLQRYIDEAETIAENSNQRYNFDEEVVVLLAQGLIEEENYEEAAQYLDDLLASEIRQVDANYLYGVLEEARDNLEEAEKRFEAAQELAPDEQAIQQRLDTLGENSGEINPPGEDQEVDAGPNSQEMVPGTQGSGQGVNSETPEPRTGTGIPSEQLP